MTYKSFTVEIDADGIALVTINVPDQTMNVWDETLIAEFPKFVEELHSNDAITGAVIASGKDNAFLAGADLRMMENMKPGKTKADFDAAFSLSGILRSMETGGHSPRAIAKEGKKAKPVACALEGLALGGGLELAMACHYRVSSSNPKIKFGLPEALVGLCPAAAAPNVCHALSDCKTQL